MSYEPNIFMYFNRVQIKEENYLFDLYVHLKKEAKT